MNIPGFPAGSPQTILQTIYTSSASGQATDITQNLAGYLVEARYKDSINAIDTCELEIADPKRIWVGEWAMKRGDYLSLNIVQMNWPKGSPMLMASFGKFQITDFDFAFGARGNTVIVKGNAAPINTGIKYQLQNRRWEAATLKQIAQYIVNQYPGLELDYQVPGDPSKYSYGIREQVDESDLAYLARLCKEEGLFMTIKSQTVIIQDERQIEAGPVVHTFTYGHGPIGGTLRLTNHDVYGAAQVINTNPVAGSTNTGSSGDPNNPNADINVPITPSDTGSSSGSDSQSEEIVPNGFSKITGTLPPTSALLYKNVYPNYGLTDTSQLSEGDNSGSNNPTNTPVTPTPLPTPSNGGNPNGDIDATSQLRLNTLSQNNLRHKNKKEKMGSIQFSGNATIRAAQVCALSGFGAFDADKYLIEQADHTINSRQGYDTAVKIHPCLPY